MWINLRGPCLHSLPPLILKFIHSEKDAMKTMKTNDWHLEGALEAYYSQEHVEAATEENRWEMLFNKYKGQDCLLKPCKLKTIYLFYTLLIQSLVIILFYI